jgi:predicted kinase
VSARARWLPGFFAPDEVLSSDELRGAIRGDPTDQSVTRVAFRILHRELAKRLATVSSSSSTRRASPARPGSRSFARRPGRRRHGRPRPPGPPAVVHARNAGRGTRAVPADVVDRHLAAAAALGASEADIAELLLPRASRRSMSWP